MPPLPPPPPPPLPTPVLVLYGNGKIVVCKPLLPLCPPSLFEQNDQIRYKFKNLRDIDDKAKLAQSKLLMSHVSMVMTTIDEAIANLSDADYAIGLLKQTGRHHTSFDTEFDPQLFWVSETVVLWYVCGVCVCVGGYFVCFLFLFYVCFCFVVC